MNPFFHCIFHQLINKVIKLDKTLFRTYRTYARIEYLGMYKFLGIDIDLGRTKIEL